MSQLLPLQTSVQDICVAALKESLALGVGQDPLPDDLNDAWARLQWMLQEWQRQRWLIYHLVTRLVISTGARSYTVGPNGDIDTTGGDFNNDFDVSFSIAPNGAGFTRPNRIESAFLRQLVQSQPNEIDYPLEQLQSMEDYNRIALKGLVAFPGSFFYDPSWPMGRIFPWPIPQANIYAVGVTIREQLPASFPALATFFNLPFEYYSAILFNLAMRLRPKYGIGTYPGDPLPGLAKGSLAVLRPSNNAISRLQVPAELQRPGIYNIFSDRSY